MVRGGALPFNEISSHAPQSPFSSICTTSAQSRWATGRNSAPWPVRAAGNTTRGSFRASLSPWRFPCAGPGDEIVIYDFNNYYAGSLSVAANFSGSALLTGPVPSLISVQDSSGVWNLALVYNGPAVSSPTTVSFSAGSTLNTETTGGSAYQDSVSQGFGTVTIPGASGPATNGPFGAFSGAVLETKMTWLDLPVMGNELRDYTVAILVADGFEQVEMTGPRKALDDAGARTLLVSIKGGQVQGMNHDEKGDTFRVEKTIDSVTAADFDALLLPGGVANPDKLRMIPEAVKFVSSFAAEHKPIAAICHGPWMLIEAGIVKGATITSWPSLKTDVTNAGGHWVDREVVVDGSIVTSRKPADIPAFNKKMIETFSSAAAQRT
jgi:protease I